MNLKSWIKSLSAVKRGAGLYWPRPLAGLGGRNSGQELRARLGCKKPFMSSLLSARRAALCLCCGVLWGISAPVSGQTNYYTHNGSEYAVIGSWPGDQVFPDAALTTNGGFVVWQDNITDGRGWGVSAMRLDSTLSGTLSPFRVNAQGTNDQQFPRVAMLKNRGAVFVWQGGKASQEHIFARLLTPTNTFLTTTDVVVSTFTNNFQINPSVTVLNNSNVVVVFGSFNQAGSNSFQDVYGQILSPSGQRVGTNFLINQFTSYNQRTPSVAALKNGGFVVAWVSEQQRTAYGFGGMDKTNGTLTTLVGSPTVDIYARLYSSNGVASGNEFLVNSNSILCANPAVAAASDGAFMVAWSGIDPANPGASGWDVFARPFSSAGVGGPVLRVNTHVEGNQFIPQIRAIGGDYMIVWTSVDQDGSLEGVYGQSVHEDGTPVKTEFRINTTTLSRQLQPTLASDGVEQFLVVWAGYNTTSFNLDLFAQRYINVNAILSAMDAPFVYEPFTLLNGVYQPQLQVSWPPLLGISVSNYEVYVDGNGTPMALTVSNVWLMTAANGLVTNSTHSFQVAYMTTAGVRSPLSPPASGSTWSGASYYGVPVEWMEAYYGLNLSSWPANVNAPLVPGGSSLYQVFLSGGSPLDPDTWLKTSLLKTAQGMYLSWNTQPGLTYQVQVTTDFITWSNLGAPRFAAANSDAIYVGGGSAGYYRVMLLRQ
jgi:hypothetical protein